jgi:tetratricopeptide (TPR) repeat protein
VARIIRICSAFALLAVPVVAEARRSDPSALGHYMRARVADSRDQAAVAVESYAAALTGAPDNAVVAFRAYREAVEAGSYPLALRAAQTLDKAGDIPPDAHLLLFIGTLKTRDWGAARKRLDALAAEPGLGFMAPMLARWVDLASRSQVPVKTSKTVDRVRNAYLQENEALIALASGDVENAVTSIKGMWVLEPYRAGSLRLAAAARLAQLGQRQRGKELIVADGGAADRARALIGKNGKPALAVVSPLDGTAFLLARIAGDLIVEGSPRSALTIARMAEFADPDNARIRLMVGGALAARKRHALALSIAESLLNDPVYGDDAASFRIDQLEGLGKADAALVEAEKRAATSPNDRARIGDIEMRRRNFAAAAAAYQAALAKAGDKAGWPLIFATGNAYDNAGDWARAMPLLEQALKLAPEEPAILNELGYGLISNGSNIERGLALVSKAVTLRPDDAAIVDSLGWAHYQRGAYAEAIPLLERAVRLDQAQAEIGEHLGDAYWAAGRRIEARYAWTAARIQADADAAKRLDAKLLDRR